MYDKIKNPITNRYVKITSKTGKNILQNYINQLMLGGASSESDGNGNKPLAIEWNEKRTQPDKGRSQRERLGLSNYIRADDPVRDKVNAAEHKREQREQREQSINECLARCRINHPSPWVSPGMRGDNLY